MSDITKCQNEKCPLKEKCWRFNAPSNEFRQAYAMFEYKEGCEYFLERKNPEVLKKVAESTSE